MSQAFSSVPGDRGRDRRGILGRFSVVLSVLLCSLVAYADSSVPVELQVALTAKVAAYDRNMDARTTKGTRLLIIRRDNKLARRQARRVKHAFEEKRRFKANLSVTIETYSGAGKLAERVRTGEVAILYFTGSFASEAGAIAGALNGVSVLTATSEIAAVRKGLVLGIGLHASRAKLYLNLPQAGKQNVNIEPRLLKIIYR